MLFRSRYVFLCGLIPVAVALVLRFFIKEPERWQTVSINSKTPRLTEIFTPGIRASTISGLLMSVTVLLTGWSCNAFIPVVAAGLAEVAANNQGIVASQVMIEHWKTTITSSFNIGGLIGTLLTIPAAKILGRKWMFSIYFALSALSILVTFGAKLPAEVQIWAWLYFAIGLTVFGIFGSFTFYLPELFPTRLRATGSGFCYGFGRIITAIGPFLIGAIASQKANVLQAALNLLFWIGFIPLIGIGFMPWVLETKGQKLTD